MQPPSARPESSGNAVAIARVIGTTLISIGLLAAAGIGIYIALTSITDALDGDDGGPNGVGTEASPSPTDGSATPTASPEGDALSGGPLSFSRLETAWGSKGIEATPGDVNAQITGFSTAPVDVTLSRGNDEMEVAVLIYDSPGAVSQDWDLGQRPVPKAGRTIPADATVWYNLNAVVVVLESNDAIRPDALEAFLSLSA
jgi:hypothetical protein